MAVARYGQPGTPERRAYEAEWRALNKERLRETQARYRERNRERIKGIQKRHYEKVLRFKRRGVTEDQFQEARDRQGDKCAICREAFTKRPRIDHSHETGLFRGLLCGPCNMGLGLFKDDPKRLHAAGEYLSVS
jgi:hypothetical protein